MSVNADTIVAAAFTVFGAMFLLRSIWQMLGALESRRWSRTRGVVLESVLEERRRSEYPLVRARIRYKYTVNGREFVGYRARFGGQTHTSWRYFARELDGRYRPGAGVTVYYDPHLPSDAVLEPGMNGILMSGLIFEMMFLAVGVLGLAVAA